jgi:hypothetical protein
MQNGGILEPKGKAPVALNRQVSIQVGVARDALKVAVAVGDILMHCSPEEAESLGHAFMMAATTVRGFIAQRTGQIIQV